MVWYSIFAVPLQLQIVKPWNTSYSHAIEPRILVLVRYGGCETVGTWRRDKRKDTHASQEARRGYREKLTSLLGDPGYQARENDRQVWQRWLHQWDTLQGLLGGSLDFTTNEGVKQKNWLCLRMASYTGFFA